MAVDPLIELRNVNKYHGAPHVLRDVDLTVGKGEMVVVIGPSGPGTSALCGTVNRLETIDSGTIAPDGQPLPQEGRALPQEGRAPAQEGRAPARLQNVSLAQIKLRRRRTDEADRRSRELLDRVGLAPQADKDPARLSGGRQLRVPPRPSRHWGRAAITRALAREPKVMLFDHPRSDRAKDSLSKILQH